MAEMLPMEIRQTRLTDRELSQLQRVEELEVVRMISTLVCLATRCGLGQTALRKLRQRAQRVGHKFFERGVRHGQEKREQIQLFCELHPHFFPTRIGSNVPQLSKHPDSTAWLIHRTHHGRRPNWRRQDIHLMN